MTATCSLSKTGFGWPGRRKASGPWCSARVSSFATPEDAELGLADDIERARVAEGDEEAVEEYLRLAFLVAGEVGLRPCSEGGEFFRGDHGGFLPEEPARRQWRNALYPACLAVHAPGGTFATSANRLARKFLSPEDSRCQNREGR